MRKTSRPCSRSWAGTTTGRRPPPRGGPRAWESKRARLELGASPVAYGPGLEERVRKLAPHGVDAALDAIGGEAIPVSLGLVDNEDRVGTIADRAGATKYGIRSLGGVRTVGRLEELVKLYERGRLRVHIQSAHPLSDAPSAHREVEAGHVRGKVVLVVG